jgi:TPR repeat protein
MPYTSLEDIYRKKNFDNVKNELVRFKHIESYIVNLFNNVTPLLMVDSDYFLWNGIYCHDNNDYENAIMYWLKGVEKKCALCALRLGKYYIQNDKYVDGLKYLLMVSDFDILKSQTYQNSMVDIGYYYLNIEQNLDEAIEWWTKEPMVMGFYHAGSQYLNKYKNDSKNVEKYEQGITWLKEAIKLKYVLAMHLLGAHYYEKNKYQDALPYLKEASDLNCTMTMYMLAKYYINIEKNHIDGLKYLCMAIELKDEDAIYEYKKMFK